MASFEILNDNKPYYLIRVKVGDDTYDQNIVSELTGAELDAFLQNYADEYEAGLTQPDV